MVIGEQSLAAVLAAFVASAALTPFVRDLALRIHWVDEPNHRSSHKQPVPRVGGIAFIIATIIGVAVATTEFEWWMIGIGAGGVIVAVSGLLDDIRPLGPLQKFLPQFGAALIAVVLLDPRILIELPFSSFTLTSGFSAALAVAWIVTVMNAFNFLDGLDGLAAGVALVTAIALAGVLPGSADLLIPFAAALGGFLLWNMAPATIFMGDGGSQFIGYLLATSVLMPWQIDTGAVPVLFMFVLVLGDAAATIVRRVLRGVSPFAGDRSHLFHGVVDAGHTHRSVAILYASLSGLSGLAGLAYYNAESTTKLGLLVSLVVGGVVTFARLLHVGARGRARVNGHNRSVVPRISRGRSLGD